MVFDHLEEVSSQVLFFDLPLQTPSIKFDIFSGQLLQVEQYLVL